MINRKEFEEHCYCHHCERCLMLKECSEAFGLEGSEPYKNCAFSNRYEKLVRHWRKKKLEKLLK